MNAINSTLELEDGTTLPYETRGDPGNRPIVLLVPADADPVPLRGLAERLSADFMVELIPLPGDGRGGDWTCAALDEAGAPALVVGYGQSCRAAFVSTRLRKVKALVVVDASLPHPDTDDPGVSTLILRGRQAERLPHEDAVSLMNRLPGSRLYELEDCGDDPAVEAPDALETAIRWFIDHLPEDGPDAYTDE
ncbi:MAG: alpha/beta hydrolase [Dehalococcoidia bacterium]|nr:alpha/beta hydrolase [Dehalococcoidia bacterium]